MKTIDASRTCKTIVFAMVILLFNSCVKPLYYTIENPVLVSTIEDFIDSAGAELDGVALRTSMQGRDTMFCDLCEISGLEMTVPSVGPD